MPQSKHFVLVLDTALNQFAPNRFGDSLRKAFALCGREDLCDNVLDPPFEPNLAFEVLDARRRLDIGLTLGEQADKLTIDPIDLRPDLAHGGAVSGVEARFFNLCHAVLSRARRAAIEALPGGANRP